MSAAKDAALEAIESSDMLSLVDLILEHPELVSAKLTETGTRAPHVHEGTCLRARR